MTRTPDTASIHHLVVTLDRDQMEPGHEYDPACTECCSHPFRISVDCPGISAGRCQAWQDCATCEAEFDAIDDDDDDDARDAFFEQTLRHGEQHQVFAGFLTVASGVCFAREAFGEDVPESAWDIAATYGPGRYPITWTGFSFEDLSVELATPAVIA